MHHPRAPVLVFRRVPGVVFPRSCLFPLSRSRSWLRFRPLPFTRAERLQTVHLVVFRNYVVEFVDIAFKQLVHLALFVHNVANSHFVLFCKRY